MPKYTEYLNIAVTPELKAAVTAEAKRQGRTPSAMARYTLARVYLADQVTVEQCADLPPIPGRQTAEEFVRGGRQLEEIEDALYGPRLRASKLVDTPTEYNAEAS